MVSLISVTFFGLNLSIVFFRLKKEELFYFFSQFSPIIEGFFSGFFILLVTNFSLRSWTKDFLGFSMYTDCERSTIYVYYFFLYIRLWIIVLECMSRDVLSETADFVGELISSIEGRKSTPTPILWNYFSYFSKTFLRMLFSRLINEEKELNLSSDLIL